MSLRRLYWLSISLFLTNCQPTKEHHGYIVDSSCLEKIKTGIGKLHREDVLSLMGTPSVVVCYDPDTWYYVSEQLIKEAFYHTEIAKTNTLIFSFTKEGILRKMESASGPVPVLFVEKSTPLPSKHGEELLKQIFRNVGRFSPLALPGR